MHRLVKEICPKCGNPRAVVPGYGFKCPTCELKPEFSGFVNGECMVYCKTPEELAWLRGYATAHGIGEEPSLNYTKAPVFIYVSTKGKLVPNTIRQMEAWLLFQYTFDLEDMDVYRARLVV